MRFYTTLFLLLCGLSAWSANRADSIRARILCPDGRVSVAIHRGAWREEPENSKEAVLRAVELGGDVIEIDVQRTADGVYVLMHDRTIDRTTTGKGRVADWTFDSLQNLYLRSGCGGLSRRRVPELFDVLNAVRGRALVNLDKAEVLFDELLPELSRRGLLGTVLLKGSAPAAEVRQKLGVYFDSVLYMPIVWIDQADAMERIERFEAELQPMAYELVFTQRNHPHVAAVAQRLKDKTLWYNTLWATLAGGLDDDTAKDQGPDSVYGVLINTLGARAIQTDRPVLLLDYLRNNHLHD